MKKFFIAGLIVAGSIGLATPVFACGGGAKAKTADSACGAEMSCDGESTHASTTDADEDAQKAKKKDAKKAKQDTPSS